MKKIVSALFAFALLFACAACTPEGKNDGENGEGQRTHGFIQLQGYQMKALLIRP